MSKRISMKEAKDWYRRHEDGERLPDIARSVKRDVRAVKQWVGKVAAEVERNAVRREAMKDAFGRHLTSLMTVVASVRSAAGDREIPMLGPTSVVFHPGRRERSLGPFNLDLDGDRLRAAWGMVEETDWKLLTEHIGKDRFVKAISNWTNAAEELANRQLTLASTVRRHVERGTGLTVTDDSPDPHATKAGIDMIFQRMVKALQTDDGSRLRWELKLRGDCVDLGPVMIATGMSGPAARVKGVESELGKLGDGNGYTTLNAAWKSYSQAAKVVEEESAILASTGFLPGECRACERLTR